MDKNNVTLAETLNIISPAPSDPNQPPATTPPALDTVIDMSNLPDGVDGRSKSRSIWSRILPKSSTEEAKKEESFASKKTAAEGMMDIALLTANANQLRFLFAYNTEAQTYYMSVSLIIASLILQVLVGVTLIFKVSSLKEEEEELRRKLRNSPRCP